VVSSPRTSGAKPSAGAPAGTPGAPIIVPVLTSLLSVRRTNGKLKRRRKGV